MSAAVRWCGVLWTLCAALVCACEDGESATADQHVSVGDQICEDYGPVGPQTEAPDGRLRCPYSTESLGPDPQSDAGRHCLSGRLGEECSHKRDCGNRMRCDVGRCRVDQPWNCVCPPGTGRRREGGDCLLLCTQAEGCPHPDRLCGADGMCAWDMDTLDLRASAVCRVSADCGGEERCSRPSGSDEGWCSLGGSPPLCPSGYYRRVIDAPDRGDYVSCIKTCCGAEDCPAGMGCDRIDRMRDWCLRPFGVCW